MGAAPSPPKSSCVCAVLERMRWIDFTPQPPSQDYPPISSIPRTSAARLDRATPTKPTPEEPLPTSSPLAAPYLSDPASATVLYLAYGSNLCAQTFLGQRGIRPISAINASAPSLRLTFDLPGLAYKEPCFANTAPRKIPKQPPKIPPEIPHPPPGFALPPPVAGSGSKEQARGDLEWDGGLIGVVYEVTPEDYATIVRTEGGGASYQDILVPCIPIATRPPGIPEKPQVPELPRPFLAHTLYAPRIPKKPGDGDGGDESSLFAAGDGGDGGDGDDKGPMDKLKDWWRNLLLQPMRSNPEYAQPSARYLKLITDGAAEHDLPADYQRYLASLQPYTITTRRQAIGQILFLGMVTPVVLFYFAMTRILADKNGRLPNWFGLLMETIFHLMWSMYDRWFKPRFGDGERTVDEDGDGDGKGVGKGWRPLRGRSSRGDEEKLNLPDR